MPLSIYPEVWYKTHFVSHIFCVDTSTNLNFTPLTSVTIVESKSSSYVHPRSPQSVVRFPREKFWYLLHLEYTCLPLRVSRGMLSLRRDESGILQWWSGSPPVDNNKRLNRLLYTEKNKFLKSIH